MKKFSIPGWYTHFRQTLDFLDYYNENRQLFYPDRIIDSVYDAYNYGSVPFLWTGGRLPLTETPLLPMHIILESYKNFPEIEIRHVFSNCLLDSDALINDYRSNEFVKNYIRENDKVILNHPKLIKHFQETYPNIPIIYSTTINLKNIDKINELTKNAIYVMNYNYNNDSEYINKLEHKENIEILCAEPCQPYCQYRTQHYKSISESVLSGGPLKNDNEYFTCPHSSEAYTFKEIMERPHAITNERVNELASQGFQYFKISGRSLPTPQWIETILYYLAKPEYCQYIYEKLINRWWMITQVNSMPQ